MSEATELAWRIRQKGAVLVRLESQIDTAPDKLTRQVLQAQSASLERIILKDRARLQRLRAGGKL